MYTDMYNSYRWHMRENTRVPFAESHAMYMYVLVNLVSPLISASISQGLSLFMSCLFLFVRK